MLKPLSDRILVEPFKGSNVSKGGLIIPESAREDQRKGQVLAVGEGTPDREMDIKPGDVVIWPKHVGSPVEVEGAHCLLMRETDIIAIL